MSLPVFKSSKVLIVGDVMLDRYWTGNTSRISPEAPVPVVRVEELEERAGGAANVALNAAALDCEVSLVGIVGVDEAATTLSKLLSDAKVKAEFVSIDSCSTITKLRVLSRHQQLIRLDFENDSLTTGAGELSKKAVPLIDKSNVVVLSDYAKGSLADAQSIIKTAKQLNKPVIVDPKGQDFTKYRGATLLTPNQGEFEAVVGVCNSDQDIEIRGAALVEELDLDALLITRSEKGMALIERHKPAYYLPARARDVYDVTGAGDTVVAMFAACVAAGESFKHAAYFSNIAASIVVSKLGAQSVTPAELQSEIQSMQPVGQGVVTEEALLNNIAVSRTNGESIVFTNGCFDLMHAGHIAYLEEAAQLGDRLVVAVNTDASVKKLKGAHRPVNPVKDRMTMLAALRCIDWVVPFDEDTPQRLIARILPDVLVKGGDYQPAEIAGAQDVEKAGGEVKILSFVEGYSTTDMINKIKQLD